MNWAVVTCHRPINKLANVTKLSRRLARALAKPISYLRVELADGSARLVPNVALKRFGVPSEGVNGRIVQTRGGFGPHQPVAGSFVVRIVIEEPATHRCGPAIVALLKQDVTQPRCGIQELAFELRPDCVGPLGVQDRREGSTIEVERRTDDVGATWVSVWDLLRQLGEGLELQREGDPRR